MKKLICGLSIFSMFTFGIVEHSNAQEQTVKVKRGMRKSTKGAIIGGSAGAVGGAIIGHGIGGAAVGGAVGAGAGYLIGRHKEHKYGGYRPVKVKTKDRD